MARFVLALFVALAVAAFAAPAVAHVHGGEHRAPETLAARTSAFDAPAKIAAAFPAVTAAAEDAAAEGAPCDRDCGHASGGCLCMSACVAMALPDLPTLARLSAAAAPPPADTPFWRAVSLGPPTPPPRR